MCGHPGLEGDRHHLVEENAPKPGRKLKLLPSSQFCLRSVLIRIIEAYEISARRVSMAKINSSLLQLYR